MCTMIATKHPLSGQGKGSSGWFEIEHLYIAYDHPQRDEADHAVLIDFAREEGKSSVRLALELSREQASNLARYILETVEEANRYEGLAGE